MTKPIKPTRDEARAKAKIQLAMLKSLIKQYPKTSILAFITFGYVLYGICNALIKLTHLIASLF